MPLVVIAMESHKRMLSSIKRNSDDSDDEAGINATIASMNEWRQPREVATTNEYLSNENINPNNNNSNDFKYHKNDLNFILKENEGFRLAILDYLKKNRIRRNDIFGHHVTFVGYWLRNQQKHLFNQSKRKFIIEAVAFAIEWYKNQIGEHSHYSNNVLSMSPAESSKRRKLSHQSQPNPTQIVTLESLSDSYNYSTPLNSQSSFLLENVSEETVLASPTNTSLPLVASCDKENDFIHAFDDVQGQDGNDNLNQSTLDISNGFQSLSTNEFDILLPLIFDKTIEPMPFHFQD